MKNVIPIVMAGGKTDGVVYLLVVCSYACADDETPLSPFVSMMQPHRLSPSVVSHWYLWIDCGCDHWTIGDDTQQ